MWFLDYYLGGAREERENFKSTININPQLRKVPEKELSKEDCLKYLVKIKDKAKMVKYHKNAEKQPQIRGWGKFFSNVLLRNRKKEF